MHEKKKYTKYSSPEARHLIIKSKCSYCSSTANRNRNKENWEDYPRPFVELLQDYSLIISNISSVKIIFKVQVYREG